MVFSRDDESSDDRTIGKVVLNDISAVDQSRIWKNDGYSARGTLPYAVLLDVSGRERWTRKQPAYEEVSSKIDHERQDSNSLDVSPCGSIIASPSR